MKEILTEKILSPYAEIEETPPPGRSPEAPGGRGYQSDDDGDDDSDRSDDDGEEKTDVFQFPPVEDPMMHTHKKTLA